MRSIKSVLDAAAVSDESADDDEPGVILCCRRVARNVLVFVNGCHMNKK